MSGWAGCEGHQAQVSMGQVNQPDPNEEPAFEGHAPVVQVTALKLVSSDLVEELQSNE